MASAPQITFPSNRLSLFQICAGIASIVGIVAAPQIWPNDIVAIIYAFFVGLLLFLSLGYIYLIHSRKLHRYAQAAAHWHHVNHKVRDDLAILANLAKKNELSKEIVRTRVSNTVNDILYAISACFSIITSAHCSVCIKEITEDKGVMYVKTFERDPIARENRERFDNSRQRHPLEENTDYNVLWYCEPGYHKNFICNDLKRRWKVGEYKNTSFNLYGKRPKRDTVLGFTVTRNWNLPYRSAFVIPIRYVEPKVDPPPNIDKDKWYYYGFLCIDCNSTKVFDKRRCPDVGGAFADILFIYFWQVDRMLDMIKFKTKVKARLNKDKNKIQHIENKNLVKINRKLIYHLKRRAAARSSNRNGQS